MIIPENLDLIKSTKYAVLDEDTSLGRRRLARRREWFDTEEQWLQYMLVIEALEIDIVAERDDGENFKVPFTWDLVGFADFDVQIKLYFFQKDLQVERN